MISASRIGGSRSGSSRRLISSRHDPELVEGSGMLPSRDLADCLHECLPSAALCRKHLAAGWRELVQASPTLTDLLRPAPIDPSSLFEPVQQRVERRGVKLERAFRPL